MRVQVQVVCAPYPRQEMEDALRIAGEHLALTADSVSVRMDPTEPRIAILEFEMRRAAQYKVVDDIFDTIQIREQTCTLPAVHGQQQSFFDQRRYTPYPG